MGRIGSEQSGRGSNNLAFTLLIVLLFVIGLAAYFGR